NSAVAGMPRPRFHAEIVPSSVSKMKSAGLELGAFRANPNEVLATIPVGVAVALLPLGGGMVTARAGFVPPNPMPVPSYNADSPEPLSLIQNGPLGKNAIPQGFNKVTSSCAAGILLVSLETRFFCTYPDPASAGPDPKIARAASKTALIQIFLSSR